jgi:hypothetical protein
VVRPERGATVLPDDGVRVRYALRKRLAEQLPIAAGLGRCLVRVEEERDLAGRELPGLDGLLGKGGGEHGRHAAGVGAGEDEVADGGVRGGGEDLFGGGVELEEGGKELVDEGVERPLEALS